VSFDLPAALDALVAVTEGGLGGVMVFKGVGVWADEYPLNNRVKARIEAQVWNIRDCLFMILLIF
jgi:hypothetical protein